MVPAPNSPDPVPAASALPTNRERSDKRLGQLSLLGKQAPILVAVAVLVFPMIGALAATATLPSVLSALTGTAIGFGPVVATVTANLQAVFGSFTAQFGFIALSIAALFVDRAVN